MPWSGSMMDGFLLAATVAGRGSGDPTEGLAPGPRHAARAGLERLRALDREDAERELRRMARALLPAPASELPPRALAVLAADLRDPRGARWLAEAPPPRRGYAAPIGLRAALRRACRPIDDGRAERELAELEGDPWGG